MNRVNTNKKEERNLEVLSNIVSLYISSAIPVSSKLVARNMANRVSSATVRNIMAELEDKGFIEQPHTSAGRVPTDTGYRYYVDMVNQKIQAERQRAKRLAGEYAQKIRSIEELLEKTSCLISRELHNAGFVMLPNVENLYLKRLELVRIRAKTVLAVLITMTNAVRNYITRLEKDLKQYELERIVNFLNTNYEDSMISDIAVDLKRIVKEKKEEDKDVMHLAEYALDIIKGIAGSTLENEIYLEGLDQFMQEPEFQDISITRHILSIFSDRSHLLHLLQKELPFQGIKIYIGRENPSDMLRGCSIITSGYSMHGRTIGRFGVMGPTRMDYCNAIRTVRSLSDIISGKLEEMNA